MEPSFGSEKLYSLARNLGRQYYSWRTKIAPLPPNNQRPVLNRVSDQGIIRPSPPPPRPPAPVIPPVVPPPIEPPRPRRTSVLLPLMLLLILVVVLGYWYWLGGQLNTIRYNSDQQDVGPAPSLKELGI